jgi:MEMO1 family protein
MTTVRKPAVAGLFYPDDAQELRSMLKSYLDSVKVEGPVPKAVIVPHAGYIYSGPVAASAYALVAHGRNHIKRIILLGPSHRVPFDGLAAPHADAFETPLGTIPVDKGSIKEIISLPQVQYMDEAHQQEHSLEVQLPFLQEVVDDFVIVPLAVGDASSIEVGAVLDRLWGGPETLIVVSSDLSHYHDYETARKIDTTTTQAIESLQPERVHPDRACGCYPINGLLTVARRCQMTAKTVDLRNSGDTAGPRDQVVGYGAYVFT